jgi:acyl-CoA synthetase (AMP-forming)/AMP-acid ligase II
MQVIGDVLRLNAKRYPEKTALIMDQQSITYRELNSQVNSLARGLLNLGIQVGDKVAIIAFNCLEFPVIVYAIAKCGAVVVPVNFRYKKDELIYVINNSSPKVLFFGSGFSSMVEEARGSFESPVQLISILEDQSKSGLTLAALTAGQSIEEPNVKVDPASPSFIMYTSGTTGFPKGTLFSHAAYIQNYLGMALEGDLKNTDVSLVCIPLFHNGGLNAMMGPTLTVGGTAVIMSKGFDPEKVLESVARYRVTVTMWVPTQLTMLINYPNVSKWDTSSLKKVYYGSSAITPATLEASLKVFNRVQFYQWYGQVETGMVSVLRPEDHTAWSQCTGREMVTADLRIVDEDGNDVGVGQTGEIISAQKPLGMIGYYRMDEANRTTLRDGWIYTGDVARNDGQGYFTIVDRLRDLIISGAENIYPKEIEDVICSHPGILEAAVFGIPDEVYGESVCAVVVAKKGHSLGQQEIIDFCASKLSSYKKPKRVEFIEDLPKNANGKVTKNVLREPYWVGRTKRI